MNSVGIRAISGKSFAYAARHLAECASLELPIKYALSRIANRRNAAKARLANKK